MLIVCNGSAHRKKNNNGGRGGVGRSFEALSSFRNVILQNSGIIFNPPKLLLTFPRLSDIPRQD